MRIVRAHNGVPAYMIIEDNCAPVCDSATCKANVARDGQTTTETYYCETGQTPVYQE
jgi:hypothetical protein